ncbi:MAG: rubredoxin [Clostridiales Family XIII bacterium]|jgi:rubrerythrin|nr:rubredoxin [Clostridiales Family XIII bacterium]
MANWVCNICGWTTEADEKPTDCPVCGAGEEAIEEA